MNNKEAGLAVGGTLAIYHATWCLLIAIGWAQGFMDFIFKIHMISNPFIVTAFSFGRAITLVLVTLVIGYLVGWVYAWLWNMVHKAE